METPPGRSCRREPNPRVHRAHGETRNPEAECPSIDAQLFKALAAHDEDLLVERKARLPNAERLGAEVASMANMLGGWLLLGVDDKTRKLSSAELPENLDLQSHVGQPSPKCRRPRSTLLADSLKVDGLDVGFIRVFQSSEIVLVSGNGPSTPVTPEAGAPSQITGPCSSSLAVSAKPRRRREEGRAERSDHRRARDIRPTVARRSDPRRRQGRAIDRDGAARRVADRRGVSSVGTLRGNLA